MTLAAVGFASCGSDKTNVATPPRLHLLIGTVTVPADYRADIGLTPITEGSACYPDDGYDDVGEGASVTVRSATGNIVGSDRLGVGKAHDVKAGFSDPTGDCVFGFSIDGIPRSKFYTIEASHRGEVTFSSAELDRQGWDVDLRVGS